MVIDLGLVVYYVTPLGLTTIHCSTRSEAWRPSVKSSRSSFLRGYRHDVKLHD